MSEQKKCTCGNSQNPEGFCDGSHRDMSRVCIVCGHVHDPATEGNWWELPADFTCPECGVGKEDYELI